MKGVQGPFLWPCQSVTVGGAYTSGIVVLFSALTWHYGTTSLVGKAPTLDDRWSSILGTPLLAHPEIAGLKGLNLLLFLSDQ